MTEGDIIIEKGAHQGDVTIPETYTGVTTTTGKIELRPDAAIAPKNAKRVRKLADENRNARPRE